MKVRSKYNIHSYIHTIRFSEQGVGTEMGEGVRAKKTR